MNQFSYSNSGLHASLRSDLETTDQSVIL